MKTMACYKLLQKIPLKQLRYKLLGIMAHVFNLSIWEIKADGSLLVQGQPGLHGDILSQKTKPNKTNPKYMGGILLTVISRKTMSEKWILGMGGQ